jgi:DNA-binding transcriptional regulator YiaG
MRATYRYWTPEEVSKLEDLVGVYDSITIGKRLGRSSDSVTRKMRNMNLKTKSAQNVKGMSPVKFAEMFGMDVRLVRDWVRAGILPKMKLPYFHCIGKKTPDWVLIDDTKIEQWLLIGYVYHRDIKPTNEYYANMVRRVRKKLDFEWISGPDLVECFNITPKVVQAWYYRHSFPRLVFWSSGMSISMYNRKDVIEWCLSHPKQVKPTKVRELHYYGIGKGL